MSLRARLFLMLSALVLALVAAQWWWVRSLTRALSSEVDEVALDVGSSVAAVLVDLETPAGCSGPGCVEHGAEEDRPARPAAGESPAAEPRTPPAAPSDPPPVTDPAAVQPSPTRQPVFEHLVVGGGGGGAIAYSFGLAEPGEPAASGVWTEERIEVRAGRQVRRHLVMRLHQPGAPAARQALHIPIHQRRIEAQLESFSRHLLLGSSGLLGLGLLLAAFLAHRASAPLRQLAAAAERLGEGKLGTQVEVRHATPEVGQAVAAFNRMSRQLEALDAHSKALQARQHLGEIGELARGLAHTLRNPLNALGLSLDELAGRAPGDDETARLAGAARRQIRRIDQRIRSFLALASQGGGAERPVDLAALAQDVVLEALQDNQQRVRIELDAGDEPLPSITAVEAELRAVLQALVVNAVEASPAGATVRVRLRPAAGGELEVEVLDRGPGLPPAVRQRLFTPHLSTKANGSGMGLFLAHRITTTRYGGRLTLDDRAGGGTRAVLRLGSRRESGNG